MNRIISFVGLAFGLALPSLLSAQMVNPPSAHAYDNGEVGAFADYFRFNPSGGTAANFVGAGGRVAFNVHPNIALEAEMNYDFARNYTTTTTTGTSSTTTSTFTTTSLRPLTGLFGPKFQIGTSSAFRAFVTGKSGSSISAAAIPIMSPGPASAAPFPASAVPEPILPSILVAAWRVSGVPSDSAPTREMRSISTTAPTTVSA